MASRNPPTPDWRETARVLMARDRGQLSGEELDALADALFWTDQVHPSVQARIEAYARHAAEGHGDQAARAAWRVFYDHWLVGERVVARSWLERGRSWVRDPTSAIAGWLAIADADVARAEATPEAPSYARRAVEIARRTGHADLRGMALLAAGRAAIAVRERATGLEHLDQAMVEVLGGSLDPLYAGWIYCGVISTCCDLAELSRASEWSEAALRWCASLRDGMLYPGLCRVYEAELALLAGNLDVAEAAADRACAALTAHDERYAGSAFYLRGEVARIRGRRAQARDAYARAHQLGHSALPGVALLRDVEGEPEQAVRALVAALRPGPVAPLPRARLICALLEVAVASEHEAGVAFGEAELGALGDPSAVVAAMKQGAAGWVAGWRGQTGDALRELQAARSALLDLRMPIEAARARVRLARVARRVGDELTAELELHAAHDVFERAGATAEAARVATLLHGADADADEQGAGLTSRELEVLRRVAAGGTNRQVAAALYVSPHTVARHLANIYEKLGVASRTAAAAWAFRNGIIEEEPPL